MLASLVTLVGCNNLEDSLPIDGRLNLSFGVQTPNSRAVITDDYLPSGAQVGVTLSGTGYDAYTNVCYTASGTGTSQSWTGSKDVLLSSSAATLYSYYPYSSTVSADAIPVETASQTDYLYGTPVTGISEAKASTGVTLNHALANMKITVAKGSYAGAGVVSKISVSGVGIATGGTFNAAQTTPGYTAYSGEGSPVERTLTSSLGTPVDVMVVPTGSSAAVTFTVTVDGTDYTATSSAVAFQMGAAYAYTLTLNSSFLAVSSFGVAGWSTSTGGSMVLDKVIPNELKVYAVRKGDEALVEYDDIDTDNEEYIAVALHATGRDFAQKFMIGKADATDGTNSTLCYDYDKGDLSLTNYSTVDGTNRIGSLPRPDGTYKSTTKLSPDFTTWTDGALSDFDGKANTAVIAASSSNSRDMCNVLNTFNGISDGSNAGKNDWYVPACGQLALMYLAMTDINAALEKIGGTTLGNGYYWSSSECSSEIAWRVFFGDGYVTRDGYVKSTPQPVRFVRDID